MVLLGVRDPDFTGLLSQRTADVYEKPMPDTDLIFLAASTQDGLSNLRELRRHLKDDGAIWVVRPKGVPGGLAEPGIIEAALASGLVDNKVVSFSPTHSALRLVIPLTQRGVARTP